MHFHLESQAGNRANCSRVDIPLQMFVELEIAPDI